MLNWPFEPNRCPRKLCELLPFLHRRTSDKQEKKEILEVAGKLRAYQHRPDYPCSEAKIALVVPI